MVRTPSNAQTISLETKQILQRHLKPPGISPPKGSLTQVLCCSSWNFSPLKKDIDIYCRILLVAMLSNEQDNYLRKNIIHYFFWNGSLNGSLNGTALSVGFNSSQPRDFWLGISYLEGKKTLSELFLICHGSKTLSFCTVCVWVCAQTHTIRAAHLLIGHINW